MTWNQTSPADGASNVVQMNGFHFDSLRKYMQPLYAVLVRNENKSKEEKHEIRRQVILEFMKRLRAYRGKSISDLAEQFHLDPEELEQIECGKCEIGSGIFTAYIESCYGQREFSHFSEKLREFHDPSTRLSKLAVAHDALKRFGIIMEGVDYKSLHSERGQLLTFAPSGGRKK